MNPQFWWFLARAGGLVALALLTLTVVWGLLLRIRLTARPAPPALLELHRVLAGLAVLFTGVHLAALVIDSHVSFGAKEILVPFASAWKPLPVALGVLALYLLLAVVVTSALMHRMPRRWWARVHRLAYLLFWAATTHTLTAGTDARNPALLGAVAAAVAAVLFLTLVRILSPERTQAGPGQPGPRFHRLEVAEVRRETADAVSVAFAVPPQLADDFRFRPGQHLTLRADVDGADLRRPYSICSGPGEPLRVAVKRIPGGRMSTWVTSSLRAGQTVEVMTPGGTFGTAVDDPRLARHVLLVGVGSGITPLLSIAATVLAGEPGSRATLLYGNRTRADILFRDRLERLQVAHGDRLRVVHVLSREPVRAPYVPGRLTPGRLPGLAGPLHAVDEVYLCGPADLTEALAGALRAGGVAADRVHVERFAAAPSPAPPAGPDTGAGLRLTFHHGGRQTTVSAAPGETILDAGLRAGLDLPYSCRAGACGTCVAVAGSATVLTCVTRPDRDRTTVSYDLN